MPSRQHICQTCGETFESKMPNAKYCSKECRPSYIPGKKMYNIPSSSIGAMSEMFASGLLLKAGFHVYRAISPAAPYDLVATRYRSIYRVEVKTGHRDKAGRLSSSKPTNDAYDILMIIDPVGMTILEAFDRDGNCLDLKKF